MFGNIAKILDEAKNNNNLPSHLVNPFQEFIADLNIVSLNHFERHVNGTRHPTPSAKMNGKTTEPSATVSFTNHKVRSASNTIPTYAAVTEAPPPNPP